MLIIIILVSFHIQWNAINIELLIYRAIIQQQITCKKEFQCACLRKVHKMQYFQQKPESEYITKIFK